MDKIDWKRKLSSRKLWVAVAGFVAGVMMAFGKSEQEAAVVGGVILQGAAVIGYLVAEGLADQAGAQLPDNVTVQITKDNFDSISE